MCPATGVHRVPLAVCRGQGAGRQSRGCATLQMGDKNRQDKGGGRDESTKAGSGNVLKVELPGSADGLDVDMTGVKEDWQGCGLRSWEQLHVLRWAHPGEE